MSRLQHIKQSVVGHLTAPMRDSLGQPARGSQLTLMLMLLFLIILYPEMEDDNIREAFFNVLVTTVVLSAVYAVSSNSRRMAVGLLFALPTVVTAWSNLFVKSLALEVTGHLFAGIFFIYTLVTILQHVVHAQRVGSNELYGAVNVYLMMGLVWALIYQLLETVRPHSFHINSGKADMATFVYFSYTTLTTLGYGDILPVSRMARALAPMEAMLGYLYVAVLVGRMVNSTSFSPDKTLDPLVETPAGWSGVARRPLVSYELRTLWLVPIVVFLNYFTSTVSGAVGVPLFLDSWGTALGVMVGGVWLGALGGVIYNLLMAFTVWGSASWVWAFCSIWVALMISYFHRRHWIDIHRPLLILGAALAVSIGNAVIVLLIGYTSDLLIYPHTGQLRHVLEVMSGSGTFARWGEPFVVEMVDKSVNFAAAAIAYFALCELWGTDRHEKN